MLVFQHNCGREIGTAKRRCCSRGWYYSTINFMVPIYFAVGNFTKGKLSLPLGCPTEIFHPMHVKVIN